MQRLFIGLPVPEPISQGLATLVPGPTAKLRPVDPAQAHLTLQFIGQAEAGPIAEALRTVSGKAFSLCFSGLGKFGSARRGAVLWAGVATNPRLSKLHETIGSKLEELDLRLETRAFTPHVTVARCRRGTPRAVIDRFLDQSLPSLPALEVREFVLYSSTTTPNGPVYSREFTFPLDPHMTVIDQ